MFKKKQIWLVMALLALTLVLYGCTELFDFAGLKDVDEQEGVQPLSATSNQFEVVNGKVRVLIGFTQRPGPPQEAMVRGMGGEIRYTYHLVPAIAATLPEAAIPGLLAKRNVTRIEPDGKVWAIDAELDNTWGVKRIGAGVVHGYNKGTGVKVAIIDSGIDYNHSDLDANYKGGYDFVNTDTDPMDDNGHGTHVAGTVAAEDNDTGVVGVAPEAELYALKVLGVDGSGSYSDVIAALQWAVDYGMQVTNNSYGSSGDPGETVKAAFDNASAAGVLNVCAAGNSGNPPGKGDNVIYPARYESCIAVAATDQSDKRARWSSTGPDLELSAPGVDINSTLLGGGYGEKSGTSMASPHVAGTAALVWVAYSSWTNAQVRAQLQNTADDLGDAGWDPQYGYGLVDADEAAAPPDTTPPVITNVTASAITSISATITWNTDEPADSLVKYGTESGNYTLEAYDSADVTSHSVGLTGLLSNTTYYYVVNSTDPSGNSAQSLEYNFTTKEAPSNTMHVASIDMSLDSRSAGPNTFVWAVAVVTIIDDSGSPVEGATVSGHWSDATSDSDSAVTDASGQVLLESDSVKNPPSGTTYTFTVGDVAKDGWTYDSTANVETSDSIMVPIAAKQ